MRPVDGEPLWLITCIPWLVFDSAGVKYVNTLKIDLFRIMYNQYPRVQKTQQQPDLKNCLWILFFKKRPELISRVVSGRRVPCLFVYADSDVLFLPTWPQRTKCLTLSWGKHTQPADKAVGLCVKTLITLLCYSSSSKTNSSESHVICWYMNNKNTSWTQQSRNTITWPQWRKHFTYRL